MSHSHDRNRIVTAMLRLLVGTTFVAGMLFTTVLGSSAQGVLGGGNVQAPSPLELCLAVFPNGIITGDPIVGDIDCSLIFGSGQPTEEPTDEPTQEPTDEPTQEPTDEPTQEPTQKPDHDHDKKHDHDGTHDHDKTHEGGKTDVGGKAGPTVTTMPSTGHATAGGGNVAASILASMALVLAAAAGVTLRLTGARNPRR